MLGNKLLLNLRLLIRLALFMMTGVLSASKIFAQKTQQFSGQRSSKPWNDANVKKGVSYASMASSQNDDLSASIHNPENNSQTLPSQQQNQFRRPKTNSAFEVTVLDQLESMNNNFDKRSE